MRKITFASIAAVALILAGIAGWSTANNRSLAMPYTSIKAQIDTFGMMASAKDLPTEEFQDFSLVFSIVEGQSSRRP